MYIGRHVKCPLFLYDFNETIIFLTDCRKNSSIKFNENPSSRSRVVPRGRTDRHEEVSSRFRNFANATNKALFISHKLALILSISISTLRTRTQLHHSGAAVKN